MDFRIDRDLPVPLGVQLRGMIEYGIACGELMRGARLPSVRDMAGRLGLAPMTVTQVYGDLRAAGLIETQRGAGTFVARRTGPAASPRRAEMRRRVAALVEEALLAGMSRSELVGLINARLDRTGVDRRALSIVFVGVFVEATAAYAEAIRERLTDADVITPTTLDELGTSPTAKARLAAADLVLTFANRRVEVAALVPASVPVHVLRFIPAETTRRALAELDPMTRLGVVSVFPEFLAVMKPGVQRFAQHVPDIRTALVGDPALPRLLAEIDALVYATGAERLVAELSRPIRAIEYRHVPDPHEITEFLLPLIEELRSQPSPRRPRRRRPVTVEGAP